MTVSPVFSQGFYNPTTVVFETRHLPFLSIDLLVSHVSEKSLNCFVNKTPN